MENEFEKSVASWFWAGELQRAYENYGRELGVYTKMVTCHCNFGRGPIKSFGSEVDSK